ncbi:MAG: trigger factor, partial [Ruminococcus sp.]|nr:trigger factor [Ruminococcus sp.]
IEVTDDEAAQEMQKIADQYKMKLDEVKKYISEEDVKKDIAVGKAVELVKDSAVIKEK